MYRVILSGSFDDPGSRQIHFLEQAARLGRVRVLLWSDAETRRVTGAEPKLPQAERKYLLEASRHVADVVECPAPVDPDALPATELAGDTLWVVPQPGDNGKKRAFLEANGLPCRVLPETRPDPFPSGETDIRPPVSGRKKVVATGCFDWFHSGHVRFFEEASEFGDLYVVIGNDESVRFLKGEGHPLFPAAERRYIVASIRHVHQCLVSTGIGWMDAEPEFARIRPDIYVVNHDGDKPEKLAFCRGTGVEYRVLKRAPKEGLPRRSSTGLRGF